MEGIFGNCFLFNTESMLISFLMFLLLTLPLLKNDSLGLEGKPAPVTHSHSARPILFRYTSKTGLQNVGKFSHFGVAVLRMGGGG